MSYNVKSIAVFERQTKRLIKKYASLKKELLDLVQVLKENPQQGTPIGKDCFKIRMPVASKGRGKSGGARLIINLVLLKTQFIFFLFMTNPKRRVLLIQSWMSFCNISLIEFARPLATYPYSIHLQP